MLEFVLKQDDPCRDPADKKRSAPGLKQNRMIRVGIKLIRREVRLDSSRTKFSEVKGNLGSIISFVNSNPQYIKYYLILGERGQT
jgi:hypothetical protein